MENLPLTREEQLKLIQQQRLTNELNKGLPPWAMVFVAPICLAFGGFAVVLGFKAVFYLINQWL